MATKAIPIVALVVHELPVATDIKALITTAVGKNIVGLMSLIP
jgi:hypothetical protein